MSEIAPMSELILDRLGSVANKAQVDLVLITLLQLRREYAADRLAFEDKNSTGGRLTFDRRLLLFLDDAPAPDGGMRFHDGGMGGRMS